MLEPIGLNFWWIVGAVLMSGVLIWKYTYEFNWFHFWYGVPVVGTLSRLNDITPDSADKVWTRAERKLCADYSTYIHLGDSAEFNKRAEYLRKAGDLGTKSTPPWGIILLWALIIAEGFGLAYSLGSFIALDASENQRTLLMIIIALVIAVPSMILSHEAGVRFHRYQTDKRYKEEWKAEGQPGKFKSATISLIQDQRQDDDQLPCTQYANRAHPKIALAPIWGALMWALVVVVLSTVMRYQHLVIEFENERTKETNPFATLNSPTPPQSVNRLDKQGEKDVKNSELVEGLAAVIMLAFLYLATQGVGAAVAAKGAFVGAQSEAAYDANFGFATYDDFFRYYEPVVMIAQARLQTLQQRLGEQHSNTALKLHKSFEDYLVEERQKRSDRRSQHSFATNESNASDASNVPVVTATGSPDQLSYCQSCGCEISPNAKFCGGCGLKLRSA